MNQYRKIFNFLWRIKRVEHTLNSIWIQHMKNQKEFNSFSKNIKKEFLKCNLLRNEMYHFITNFFSYIMVEVVESKTSKKNIQKKKKNLRK
jgi:gamma-tubulin complex component 3